MANLADDYADLTLRLRDGLMARVLVETGTMTGNSTVWAAAHFDRVVSIDMRSDYQEEARRRCAEVPGSNVRFLLGDSRRLLPLVMSGIETPCVFFLDAHNEAQQFGPGPDDCPVLAELETIFATAAYARHAILVDDAHCFSEPYDPAVWPRRERIEALAREFGYVVRLGAPEAKPLSKLLAIVTNKDLHLLDGTPWA